MEDCWPSGIVLWGMVSNHYVLRWLKTVVVSDVEKASLRRQVGIAPAPLAVDSPEYSSAAAPTSALAVGVTVIAGLVSPRQRSARSKRSSRCLRSFEVQDLAVGVPGRIGHALAVAPELLQTPTRTIKRSPPVMLEDGVTAQLVTFSA